VLPLIRRDAGQDDARPLTTGASLGAFSLANTYFKHPDLFRGVKAMSGTTIFVPTCMVTDDDNVYFNNPADYLANLNDDFHLPLLRRRMRLSFFQARAPTRPRKESGLSTS